MATAKRTSTVKPVTKSGTAKAEPIKPAAPSSTAAVQEAEKKAPTQYANDTPIACKSVTVGGVYMVGKKTQELYKWNGRGDVTEVEYQDLKAARLTKSSVLFKPLVIIEDKALVEEWKDISELYSSVITDEEINALFTTTPEKLKAVLTSLPKGLQTAIANLATQAVREGKLDKLSLMKVFDEVLGTDLKLQLEG